MSTQDELKKSVAKAAAATLPENKFIGIGSGSTVNFFIEEISHRREHISGCVATSEATREWLNKCGLKLVSLNDVYPLPIYYDGADEVNYSGEMIKGGGGALTQEKIIASASKKFVCLVDSSKLVKKLGKFPLPIEVIPISCVHVQKNIEDLGGRAIVREGVVTDNGNLILDVIDLNLEKLKNIEERINNLPGVVENGIFATRKCDELLVASSHGVEKIIF